MPIVDPFKTPASSDAGGIVDPFKTGTAKTEPDFDVNNLMAKAEAEKADHGRARRSRMSQAELAASPFTEYPRNYEELRNEAYSQFGSGLSQLGHAMASGKPLYEEGGPASLWEGVKGAGNVLGGAFNIPYSPIKAAIRSFGTQPLEDVTRIPREYPEFAADLALPGVGLRGAIRPPLWELGAQRSPLAERFMPRPPEAQPGFAATRAPPPTDMQAALQRLDQAGMRLDLPRAVTSESPTVRAGSQALSYVPYSGTPLREAVQAVPARVGEHVETIAAEHAPATPKNIVGSGIERSLTRAAEDEAATVRRAWETENAARVQAIEARQADATNAAEQAFGNVHPMEMAQDTINDVQSAHRQARVAKDAAYDAVGNLDARVKNSGFLDLRQRAEQALKDADFTIDDPGTNASKMLAELDKLSGRAGTPSTPPPGVPKKLQDALDKTYGAGNVPEQVYKEFGFTGGTPGTEPIPPDFRLTGADAPAPGSDAISVQGLERLSQRLRNMGMDAVERSDRAASRIVKGAFDDWHNDVLGSHLTADSEAGAGAVIDRARAAHRDLMQRFGYNYRRAPEGEPRNAQKFLNQLVTEGAGPEALRDNLIGATKPGNRPISSPLYEAIRNAVPDADAFRNRLRGAYWNRLSEGNATTNARLIDGVTPTRMGSHLFDAGEQNILRNAARAGEEAPAQLKEAQRLARESEPQTGKAEEARKSVFGYNRSEEQAVDKLDAMMRGTGIKDFARAWGRMSPADRASFKGHWVRNLGGDGENFNLGTFVKNWETYSDQSKVVMLGREHRQNLDDIYTAAKRYSDNIAKYGNPSGTAQVRAWHDLAKDAAKAAGTLATGAFTIGPIQTVVAGVGLRKLAKILATPEGAANVSRWNRLANAYTRSPNSRTLHLLGRATRSINDQ
jgi:hypothetical protein